MKIFITGATGYIGEAVAIALRRNGHEVHALARNESKAKNLILNEVQVTIGELGKVEGWKDVAAKCSVLIHAAADYTNFEGIDSSTINTFLDLGKVNPGSKTLIYTSGVLVYADNLTKVYDEDDATDPNMFPMLKGRPIREQQVISSKDVHGVVIRPGFVFGKNENFFANHFKQALEGKVVVSGRGEITWSQIHLDDLTDAYVRVVEASSNIVSGQIFNITDDSRVNNLQIATTLARVAGYKGEITVDVGSGMPFSNKSVIASSRKATRVLGWTPKHLHMLDEAEVYFKLWKARTA